MNLSNAGILPQIKTVANTNNWLRASTERCSEGVLTERKSELRPELFADQAHQPNEDDCRPPTFVFVSVSVSALVDGISQIQSIFITATSDDTNISEATAI